MLINLPNSAVLRPRDSEQLYLIYSDQHAAEIHVISSWLVVQWTCMGIALQQ